MPTQERIERAARMADYSELLARLAAGLPYRSVPTTEAERASYPSVIKDIINEDALRAERAECAAAIRALIAERDAAVLAERKACAKVCRDRGKLNTSRGITYLATESNDCASAIRARSNG